jgi:N-methylhydantoinase A
VTSAANVWPQVGEYERTTLALLDAQITPLMTGYFTALRERLRRLHVDARLYISTSNGGSVSIDEAIRRPIQTVLSGPAGGVSAAASSWPGLDMVTVDMGGTSSDIGVLRGGRPVLSTTATIGPHPIMMPVVEVSAIGAGGGSVVWGDRGGARPVLRVGPESVGADPGPAGYGLGGTRAALTDAYVHAGVIDPAAFLGGAFPLKPDLSTAALAAVADDADSIDADRTVDAALRVATAGMAARLRTVLAAHGDVPATFTFVAFGGAGGTHVALLAEDVGVSRVLVPATAGTFCALGAAIAPLRRDLARTVRITVDEGGRDELARAAAGIAADGRAWLQAQDSDTTGTIRVSADMRYTGQPTTLEVALAERGLDIDGIRRQFDEEHRRVHGFADAAAGVRVETVRASVTADLGEVRQGRAGGGFTGDVERDIRYDGTVRRATVHRFGPDGDRDRITGPAVVERPDTTVLVPAGWSATCDDAGTLHLVRDPRGE